MGKWDLVFRNFNHFKNDNNKFLFLYDNSFTYYFYFYSNIIYNIFNQYSNIIQFKNKIYNYLLYKLNFKYNINVKYVNIPFLYMDNNIELNYVYKKYKKHVNLWNSILINKRQ